MLGRRVIRFDAVSSTMDVLSQLAARGAQDGTVVVADFQTHGRGRVDRQWSAPPGTALLHSVLLRPGMAMAQLSPLSLLVADAVVATLRDVHGVSSQIKWPNDVLIGGRKISGILIRTRITPGDAFPAVVIGVGINANAGPGDLPPGAPSLLVETGRRTDRTELMREFLERLDVRYQELRKRDLEDRLEQIRGVLAMRGEHVTVVEGRGSVTGRLLGIDADGALLLQLDGSEPRRVVVGDLTRGPRAVNGTGS
jgi:BirA family transcriptional regulator, biotin operon repressor / biotin---[acetyl-CoA-carboxylase] ligase